MRLNTVSLSSDFLDVVGVRLAAAVAERFERPVESPWLTVQQAAARAGYDCVKGRAPESIYRLARQIGHKVGSHWLIHLDDLDRAIREGRLR
jgi:hypothetical protein